MKAITFFEGRNILIKTLSHAISMSRMDYGMNDRMDIIIIFLKLPQNSTGKINFMETTLEM